MRLKGQPGMCLAPGPTPGCLDLPLLSCLPPWLKGVLGPQLSGRCGVGQAGNITWLPVLNSFRHHLEAAWGWLTSRLDRGCLEERQE